MRYILSLALISFLLTGRVEAAETPPQVPSDPAVSAINAFALDAYTLLASEDKGNLFFSPYSVSSALAMTYGGASGDTALEMGRALHFSGIHDALHPSMKALYQRLNDLPADLGIVNAANRLWLDKEEKLLPGYTSLIADYYGGGLEQLDFRHEPESSRKAINAWVEEKTYDRIRDLLREGDVNPTTRLVLTNAIYFKSAWRFPFEKESTKKLPFRLSAKENKKVETMYRKGDFSYAEVDGVQLLKIPYTLRGFSMMVLLPRVTPKFDQLEVLERKLSEKGSADTVLKAWMQEMRPSEVQLWMPKFKDEGRFALRGLLEKLGMEKAFSDDADFSGMVDDNSLRMDAVIHQAFIELDENGTEAAAATAVIMMTRGVSVQSPKKPVEFRADHPFVYFIADDDSGAILFMGRMAKPE